MSAPVSSSTTNPSFSEWTGVFGDAKMIMPALTALQNRISSGLSLPDSKISQWTRSGTSIFQDWLLQR